MISADTLQFIADLKENNNRDWFKANKKRYESAIGEHNAFALELINRIGAWEPAIKDMPLKKAVFRIYRDVRFSKDKSPYKTHFGSFYHPWQEVQRDEEVWPAGWYVHIEPGDKSFVGGGLYEPEKNTLAAIRQEIDYDLEEWNAIINHPIFVKTFSKGVEGRKLQRPPKGYAPDNAAIEWLKHKEWVAGAPIKDKEWGGKNIMAKIEDIMKTMHPWMQFLNRPFEGLQKSS